MKNKPDSGKNAEKPKFCWHLQKECEALAASEARINELETIIDVHNEVFPKAENIIKDLRKKLAEKDKEIKGLLRQLGMFSDLDKEQDEEIASLRERVELYAMSVGIGSPKFEEVRKAYEEQAVQQALSELRDEIIVSSPKRSVKG